jgi:uncharacterized protein YdhG (YjbR/CyaY superfamily)
MSTSDVDEYFRALPEVTAAVLQELRTHLHGLVPGGEERISYGIPTLDLDGWHVVHFGGFKHHVSIYPVVDVDPALERTLAPYRGGRGTVKFALDKPLPYEVIDPLVALLLDRHRAR